MNDLSVALTPVDQNVKIKKTSTRLPTAQIKRVMSAVPAAFNGPNVVPICIPGANSNAVPLRDINPRNHNQSYGQPPMMYTPEQQQQYQNNRPSIVSQLPEVPGKYHRKKFLIVIFILVAPDLRYLNNPSMQQQPPQRSVPTTDQMYANYQTQQQMQPFQQHPQQQYHQQQQGPPRSQAPTYASLAAQNQDFSMDVDNISGANTQVTRQVPNFQTASQNQSMYQGQYDWQW